MVDSGRTTYTEALGEVREMLATLAERSEGTNRRLDSIERKLTSLCTESDSLRQRVTKVETNQGIYGSLLATLSVVGSAIAAYLGIRS